MRIEIKTNKPVRDRDVRALFIINHALKQSTPRMKVHNLAFFADRFGLKLVPKESR